MESFGDAESIKLTSCGHVFCGDCLAKWGEKNGRCPICREIMEGGQSKGASATVAVTAAPDAAADIDV